jgi:streptogramin lyase
VGGPWYATALFPCLLFVLALSGCSVRSSSVPSVVSDVATASVGVRLIVGESSVKSSAAAARAPRFISTATLGVDLKVMSGAAVVAETVVDVSPGSAACGGSTSSPRTCSASTTLVPHGTYALVATTYDKAPVAGAIPGTAHALATSMVTGVAVVDRTTTNATIYVSGIVSAYGAPGFVSLSADGAAHQVGFALAPTDYANEPIVAGVNDPYSNPITLALTEVGGTGHVSLRLNGSNVGASATVLRSSDAVQVSYDGGGSAGYYATVAISASGVATSTINVSPMFVVMSGPYGSGSAANFIAAGQTSTATITEAGAQNSVTYSATPTGCSGVASVGAVSGTGASASAVITAGSTGAAGCSVVFTDNVGTSTSVAVNVATTVTTTPLTVQGGYAEFVVPGGGGVGNLDALHVGVDGRMWFCEFNTATIGAIDSSGTITRYATATAASNPTSIALGPDGRMWYAEPSTTRVGAMAPDGTTVDYPISIGSQAVAAGPDNRIWFTEPTSNIVAVITTGGKGLVEYPVGFQGVAIAAGPDGRMWAVPQSGATVYAIGTGTNGTVAGSLTAYTTGITPGAALTRIAAGPDGALWFTENNKSKIGRITTSGSVSEYSTTVGSPKDIVAGLDGNMWYTDNSFAGHTIGKVGTGMNGTTLGVVTRIVGSAALGMSGNTPSGIAVGPDSNVWFTERASNNIVRFTP